MPYSSCLRASSFLPGDTGVLQTFMLLLKDFAKRSGAGRIGQGLSLHTR